MGDVSSSALPEDIMSVVKPLDRTATPTLPAFSLNRPMAVLVPVVVALVANIALWLVGLAAGGTFEVTNGDTVESAAPGGVLVMTVVPLTVGMGLAALLSLRWFGIVRVAEVVGAVAALGTIASTIVADFDTPSTITLSLMHVVIAIVVVGGLEAMRNRIAAQR
ncbi:DUF6069 family protein [Rhodococcus ruber]|nr:MULTISPECIES: DUF6069 family protein [Rhodococcus]ATQ29933.1 hypothetical protein CS378_15120 [Rhodococcus ruber]AWH01351.1 hypothetical protein DCN13_23635 [Rhodococcus ruber]AXY54700.1 membrane protein [Rhodococcus ruber]MDO1479556.1 hypothetical protein [Rhodococcus ruber]UQB72714.1 hypothetical protein KI427_24950 [Rhodococcus ruber]